MQLVKDPAAYILKWSRIRKGELALPVEHVVRVHNTRVKRKKYFTLDKTERI